MENLNRTLFLLVNAGPHPQEAALQFAVFLAQWPIYGVPLLLATMWLWGTSATRKAAVFAGIVITVALLCNQVIAALWPHPRPFMTGFGHNYLAHAVEPSFPSDHATVFFAFAWASLLDSLRRQALLILLLGIAVGWARVYLCVHYPFDILGALFISGFIAAFLSRPFHASKTAHKAIVALETAYRRIFAKLIAKGLARF